LPYTTSKEELDETSDKDETQVNSRNQQVDPSGNQDQAIDQEELNPQDNNAIGPQASKDDPLPNLPTPAQSPEPQSNITTAPSAQALSVQAPPVQAPPVQAPPIQAPPVQPPSVQPPSAQVPSTQAPPAQAPPTQPPSAQPPSTQPPSAQAPPAQALLVSPYSLTKAKEPRQPSSYKPPQPAQQSLPAATASTLPLLHMDQPTYDPLGAHITSICQPKTSFDLPFAAQSSAVIWEKEYPSQGAYTTFFMDRHYRQQYQNPPPVPPLRPLVSQKAV
jgi:hypothetical protein